MKTHTPTPWILRDNEIIATTVWTIRANEEEGEEGIPVAVVNLTGAMGGEDGDAEFIVRACNAFDALVKALGQLNHMGGDERGGYCICPLNDGSAPDFKHASSCQDARAALKLAD